MRVRHRSQEDLAALRAPRLIARGAHARPPSHPERRGWLRLRRFGGAPCPADRIRAPTTERPTTPGGGSGEIVHPPEVARRIGARPTLPAFASLAIRGTTAVVRLVVVSLWKLRYSLVTARYRRGLHPESRDRLLGKHYGLPSWANGALASNLLKRSRTIERPARPSCK